MIKKSIVATFALLSTLSYSNSNLLLHKENLRAKLIETSLYIEQMKTEGVAIADRLEADVYLEMVGRDYSIYTGSYKNSYKTRLVKAKEALLIMPRIDLLEANLEKLSESAEQVYVFIMEGDKLEENELYGDRSYETYLASGIDRELPSNVKVVRLYNQSVGAYKGKNNFEIDVPIVETQVFNDQIIQIYRQLSKNRYF